MITCECGERTKTAPCIMCRLVDIGDDPEGPELSFDEDVPSEDYVWDLVQRMKRNAWERKKLRR